MSYLSRLTLHCETREEWEGMLEELRGESAKRQAQTLNNHHYWENALHWMDEGDDIKKSFMDEFMKGDTRKRMVAAMGLSAVNSSPGRSLIAEAREIKERMKAGHDCDDELLDLAYQLVGIVEIGDHKTLATAGKFLKGDYDDPKKGEFAQAPGDVWRAFCQYHIETGLLPTKGKLDELAGVEDGRKIRGPLGLNGLPERF